MLRLIFISIKRTLKNFENFQIGKLLAKLSHHTETINGIALVTQINNEIETSNKSSKTSMIVALSSDKSLSVSFFN